MWLQGEWDEAPSAEELQVSVLEAGGLTQPQVRQRRKGGGRGRAQRVRFVCGLCEVYDMRFWGTACACEGCAVCPNCSCWHARMSDVWLQILVRYECGGGEVQGKEHV